jgi:predicted nucleotidyltransferase
MNILVDEHKILLEKLLDNKVDFILVGGLAVVFYGYKRTTGDMDIWLKPSEENKRKLISVLKADKIFEEDIQYLESLEFQKPLAFHIGEEPLKIDFLTHISGVNYEEANSLKNYFQSDNYQIPIIHLNHLIASKISTGRLKDKADVEELQKINKNKKE